MSNEPGKSGSLSHRPEVFMRVYYGDHHRLDLPEGHPFPVDKYAMLRRALLSTGVIRDDQMRPSQFLDIQRLYAVHDRDYVHQFVEGSLPEKAMRRIGFPWSESLVKRCLASVHGTVEASRYALLQWRHGSLAVSGHLAGGTHHAHRDFGAGYCVFNDIAVAASELLEEEDVNRILVLDVDVHQGDGTAAIFSNDSRVFTVSIHGERNFPFRKSKSDFDIGLQDGTEDEEFLKAVEEGIETGFEAIDPQFVFVQGGVDALREDRLGRMNISFEGLRRRDEMLAGAVLSRGLPMTWTLGGGYSHPVDATVEAHLGTYETLIGLVGEDR